MNGIKYAGFWKRFVAYIIDQLILSLARTILFVPIWFFIFMRFFTGGGFNRFDNYTTVSRFQHQDESYIAFFAAWMLIILIFAILNIIIEWLYYSLMESSARQATFGKIILSIKVTDLNGNRISFGKATGRYFGKILSGIVLCIGYIMAGFTEKKQALHDILAGCLVVESISVYDFEPRTK